MGMPERSCRTECSPLCPFRPFTADWALPSSVRGPVDRSHGFVISAACRNRSRVAGDSGVLNRFSLPAATRLGLGDKALLQLMADCPPLFIGQLAVRLVLGSRRLALVVDVRDLLIAGGDVLLSHDRHALGDHRRAVFAQSQGGASNHLTIANLPRRCTLRPAPGTRTQRPSCTAGRCCGGQSPVARRAFARSGRSGFLPLPAASPGTSRSFPVKSAS